MNIQYMVVIAGKIVKYDFFSHQPVSENFVLCAGCFTSGTSSLFPAGSIRLSDSMMEMMRYQFVFDCVNVSI